MKTYIYSITGDNSFSRIRIPYNNKKVDEVACPKSKCINGYFLVRFDSLHSAYNFSNNIEEYYSTILNGRASLNLDYYNSETEEYTYYTELELWNTIIREYLENGCIYIVLVDDSKVLGENKVIVTSSSAKVCMGKVVFSATFTIGDKIFYLVNNNKDLRFGIISSIICEKKDGYSATISYKMTNGDTVLQNNIMTKEMTFNWLNSKS